jgi:hypothetical protein
MKKFSNLLDRLPTRNDLKKELYLLTTIGLIGITGVYCTRLVQSYGWSGALRYIWEGDSEENLDAAQNSLEKCNRKITVLEEGLKQAQIKTSNKADLSQVLLIWRHSIPSNISDLRTHLALLSHDLDKAAAKIDQAPSNEISRARKKDLSRTVVNLMDRADALIAFFKTASLES